MASRERSVRAPNCRAGRSRGTVSLSAELPIGRGCAARSITIVRQFIASLALVLVAACSSSGSNAAAVTKAQDAANPKCLKAGKQYAGYKVGVVVISRDGTFKCSATRVHLVTCRGGASGMESDLIMFVVRSGRPVELNRVSEVNPPCPVRQANAGTDLPLYVLVRRAHREHSGWVRDDTERMTARPRSPRLLPILAQAGVVAAAFVLPALLLTGRLGWDPRPGHPFYDDHLLVVRAVTFIVWFAPAFLAGLLIGRRVHDQTRVVTAIAAIAATTFLFFAFGGLSDRVTRLRDFIGPPPPF
jgi:hypothetical protein